MTRPVLRRARARTVPAPPGTGPEDGGALGSDRDDRHAGAFVDPRCGSRYPASVLYRRSLAVLSAVVLAACGPGLPAVDAGLDARAPVVDGGPRDATAADAWDPADATPIDAAPIDAAPIDAAPIDAYRPCTSDSTCDDADDCTEDRCVGGACTHPRGPADLDSDGHERVACGGDDCDDSHGRRYGGAPEVCDDADTDCDGRVDESPVDCVSPWICAEYGICGCWPPLNTCGAASECVDPRSDPRHCGGCDRACGEGGTCVASECVCSGGRAYCDGTGCVDLTTDASHCGGCGVACTGGATCTGGACRCPAGGSYCPGVGCVDTTSDWDHCGACGARCGYADLACVDGLCDRCGDPGDPCCQRGAVACHTGTSCSAGVCTCLTGVACDGACVDTQTSPLHCGACGAACAAGEICSGGACAPCGGADEPCCASASCDSGGLCTAGTCRCAPGTVRCGERCAYVDRDDAHCGACDAACGPGLACGDAHCDVARTIAGTVTAIVVHPGGDVVVAGELTATTDLGDGPIAVAAGSRRGFLARYTATGALVWARSWASPWVRFLGATLDADGNIYLAGYFAGTIDLGGGPLVSGGGASSEDALLASFTPGGAHRWSRGYGGDGSDEAWGIGVDASGNVYASGYFARSVSFGGATLTSAGYNDAWIASWTTDGAHRWSVRRGSSGWDGSTALAVDASGTVFVGGWLPGATAEDAWVASYTSAGAVRWSQSTGGSGIESVRAIALDPDGHVYVAGASAGDAPLLGLPIGTRRTSMFVASWTNTGAHRWGRAWAVGGSTYERGAEAVFVRGDDVLVSGTFDGAFDPGTGAPAIRGDTADGVIVRVARATGAPSAALWAAPGRVEAAAPMGTARAAIGGDGFLRFTASP